MSEKIDKTLKKIAAGMLKGNTPTSSSTEPRSNTYDLPGDPDCPYCHGVGFLRRDLPVGHPDFGKLEICSCRLAEVGQQVRQRLFSMSNLSQLRPLRISTRVDGWAYGRSRLIPWNRLITRQCISHDP
jgi:hypothetical protein